MKKALLIAVLFCFGFILQAQAQAFEKGGKYLSLGVGGSNFWHIVSYEYRGVNIGTYNPVTFQFNFQAEFSVHKYVGVGFITGFGARGSDYWYRSAGEFNMPFGAIGNFHFYQLIADKTGKNIHADKLDVYAGVNVGSGFAIFTTSPSTAAALVFAGPQFGVRYFFTPKIAVNGEIGYGKSWVNGGFTFKVGR